MDFNVSPYYDDYDEEKKFLRVLFRPGYSIQARELTQAQTILQNQVSRVGDYVFKNNSRVIPGELKRFEATSIKLQTTEVDRGTNLDTFLPAVTDITVTGETTGVSATIVLGEATTTVGDPPLLHVKYISAGFNGESEFSQNEVLKFQVIGVPTTTTVGGITTTTSSAPTYTNPRTGAVITAPTGSYRVRIQNSPDFSNKSLIINISSGIFYTKGLFVMNDSQKICLSKYTTNATAVVGLDIVETIVTPEVDTTLLDNANGTPNYTAPGAHRYQINLVLTSKEVGFGADKFIHLLTLKSGIVQYEAKGTGLAELEKVMARRANDTTGDFTVQSFDIEMKEHRNSDQAKWTGLTNYQDGDVVFYPDPITNKNNYYVCLDNGVSGSSPPVHQSGAVGDGGVRWRYTTVPQYDYGLYSDMDGGDTNKVAFGVKNGKAYVKGYEYATNGVRYVPADKARDYTKISNTSVSTDLGNIIDVLPFGTPDLTNYQIVDLYAMDVPQAMGASTAVMTASANGAGTVTAWNGTPAKLCYALVQHQLNSTSQWDWQVAKVLAGGTTTTTFPVALNSWNAVSGTANTWAPVNTSSRIGTARIRYLESGPSINSKATARLSLFDIQMDPGKDFRKVRIIGTPLSVGSTSTGGDPNCFRAMVIPQTYNSINIGQATISTSGNYQATMTGLGTKWLSTANVSPGDFVWFPNAPSQWFMVRDLQGSDRNMGVTSYGSFAISGQLQRADCIMYNPSNSSGLYPMPKNNIYTIRGGDSLNVNNTTYTTLQKYTVTGDSGATYVSLNFSTTDPDQITVNDVNSYVIINNMNGEQVFPYDVKINTSTNATIRLNASSSRQSLIDGNVTSLQASTVTSGFTVYAPILRRLQSSKEKTKSLFTQTLELTLQPTVELETIKLNKADIFRLLKVEMFPNVVFGNDISTIASGTGVDITNNYKLDNGQRDTHYDIGRIVKGKSVAYPTGPIRITFEYFQHTSGDYFSVDSYPDLLYSEIPNFNSPVTGETVSMRDVLDFRPRMNDAGTFSGGTASLTTMPQRKYSFQCDYAYYLGRKDKIVLNKKGDFIVIKGVSADNPQLPQAPSDTMQLFDIEYSPYTHFVNTNNILITPIDNRGYTMKDIAKLEKRISNLEQQTALTSLEKSTAQLSIKDQDGLDRFKNGFVVDNFTGHNIGNVMEPDYECAIDPIEQSLRPAFDTIGVDLVEVVNNTTDRSTAGYRIHGENIVTLPYYEGPQYFYKNKNEIASILALGTKATSAQMSRKELITRENGDLTILEQPYATEQTQITTVQTSNSGIVTLYPATDTWVETTIPADLVINTGGSYDSVAAQADALGIDFGTFWNSWQIASLGKPITTVSSAVVGQTSGHITGWNYTNTTTATTTVVSQQVNLTATGTSTTLDETVGMTTVSGRLTAQQSISYIRSRPISFVASGMKAGTRLYAFCDQTDVTAYCTQAARLYIASRPFNYSVVPYQYGASTTERQIYLTFNTQDIFTSDTSNFERTFSGSLVYDVGAYNTTFTSVYSGTTAQPTSVTNVTQLSDTGKALFPINMEQTGFTKGEVIVGAISGATGIVVLHEQSTNATTGQPDGVLDTLHVINIRGTFKAGETINGTVKRPELNGNVLSLQLRANTPYEIAAPGVLVSTGTGRIAGVWTITSGQVVNNVASPKFLTGKRVFSLQDTTSNQPATTGLINRTTYANAIYSAIGIIDAGVNGVVGVRNATIGVGDVTRDSSYVQTLSTSTSYSTTTTYVQSQDPLAQTFIVSTSSGDAQDGSFITGVELFFGSKDATQPVVVELKTTTNGYPSSDVLPFGRKTLYPSDILVSPKGDLGTYVQFPAPVHVQEGSMYAVSVATASPSYTLWTATLGKNDVTSGGLGTVIKSPASGSLFKSQNTSTWTESPNQDMKLVVYRAIFNTVDTQLSSSYLNLKSKDVPLSNNLGRTTSFTKLAKNAFQVKLGYSEIIVTHPNHGMSDGSYVSFQNVTGADQFGFANADFNTGTFTQYQYDIKTQTKIPTGTSVQHQVYNVYSVDKFSIRIYDSSGAAKLATSSGNFGGTQVVASKNAAFTTLHPALNLLNFHSTSTQGQVRTTSGRSVSGNETPYLKDSNWTDITLNDNNNFTSQRVILNKDNEYNLLSGSSSFDLRVLMTSTNRFVSPIVDIQRASAVVTQNRVDDPTTTKNINSNYYSVLQKFDGTDILTSEYDTSQGGVQMGYITRKLQFANSSTLLKIQLAASIPSNTGIDKTTPTVTLPMKFKSGSFISEHPSIYQQRTAVSTAYAIGTTAITLQAVTNLVDGMYVYGPGIQSQTRINGISGSIITLDKALKSAMPSTTGGIVLSFSAFDITLQDKTRSIDVGDYVSTTVANAIPSGTYVTKAPKNSYFTKYVGSYASGSFVAASATTPVTLFNSTIGGIDPTTNNFTVYLDSLTNIQQGMFCYIKFYNSNDGTYSYGPGTIRKVLSINSNAKSVVLSPLTSTYTDEWSTTGYSAYFYFNSNNAQITFFNPVVKLSQATTAAIDPAMSTRTQTNLTTFTTPPNSEIEIYAKISNGGVSTTTNALQFQSNEYNAGTNPYGVDSTNDIIYFPVNHNLTTGSQVLYNAQANTITGLLNGSTYYVVYVSPTSIKLAIDLTTATAIAAGVVGYSPINLTSTSVQENHTFTDLNQKNQSSIDDSMYFRIMPDGAAGGDYTTYGGINPLTFKGQLTTIDDPSQFIDHTFTADNLTPFNTVVLKICMRSRNPAYVPKIQNLRVIATA